MNEVEKAQLKKLVANSEAEDNTNYIREFKNSELILENVKKIELLKKKHAALRKKNTGDFEDICKQECELLYNGFTLIFNKIIKDEINLAILFQLIHVLRKIENNEVDQHEGSALVGKILKELYIDSAIRKGEKLDQEHAKESPSSGKPISWKEYKTSISGSDT